MSVDSRRTYLTFALLDSLSSSPIAKDSSLTKDTIVKRIGPLVEFAYLDYPNAITRLSSPNHSQEINSLQAALDKSGISRFQTTTSLDPNKFEFMRGFQSLAEADDLRWMMFCKRLENAAASVGLGGSLSKALAGTVEEMTSNVLEHSEHAETSLVGYRCSQREFEYVVADSGIGVLQSRRKNSYYSHLEDSREALETAVQEGESRRGHYLGHGLGFRDLLNNIANRDSYLRFRSGNYALVIDGTQSPPVWETRACQSIAGFLISIVSKAPQTK